ncbi:hypothetical protein BJ170DRAFT_302086 [Xylariales sp. AK1849]|nr:hypothetical protein BJ170DRAFT_302086 [Xylariales sp. AK1849]
MREDFHLTESRAVFFELSNSNIGSKKGTRLLTCNGTAEGSPWSRQLPNFILGRCRRWYLAGRFSGRCPSCPLTSLAFSQLGPVQSIFRRWNDRLRDQTGTRTSSSIQPGSGPLCCLSLKPTDCRKEYTYTDLLVLASPRCHSCQYVFRISDRTIYPTGIRATVTFELLTSWGRKPALERGIYTYGGPSYCPKSHVRARKSISLSSDDTCGIHF